jgi:formylglycine-generating enzyme required for sulfatase activity
MTRVTVFIFCSVLAWAFQAPAKMPQPAASGAKPDNYVEKISGTAATIDMIGVPGGTFTMGSPASEKGRSVDEGPQHEVRIPPFWIAKTEITWDQYDPFAFGTDIGKAPTTQAPASATSADAITRPTPPYADESFGYGKGSQPAIDMTWHAAMEYCRWLSAKTGKTYRLATEAEWEYAARAGTTTAYSFGDDPKVVGDYGWTTENSNDRPHPVAQKKPNAWGLYDMHGNVAEWVLDQYDAGFYKSIAPLAIDPVRLPENRRYPHVTRGGSWDHEAPVARSAARLPSAPDWSRRDPQIPKSIWWHTDATFAGFRIVRPVEEQEKLKGFKSPITVDSPQ